MMALVQSTTAEELPTDHDTLARKLEQLTASATSETVKRDIFYVEQKETKRPPEKVVERNTPTPPRLVGAFVSGGRQEAFFMVETESVTVREGDTIAGFRVLGIESSGVLVEEIRSGRKLRLGLAGN